MADVNNIPAAEDTKTKVTAKVSGDTPGKQAPAIDLNTAPPAAETPAAAADPAAAAPKTAPANTMTGRTMKLQGLAGMAAPKPAVSPAPSAAPAAPAAPAENADDTRTRRTVKLASLAAAPAIKPLDLTGASQAKKAPSVVTVEKDQNSAASTVTRRTQKLEALDTQEVAALEPAALDTATKKAAKINAVAVAPAPQTLNKASGGARHTIKVETIAPGNIPSAAASADPKTVQVAAPAAAAEDTTTRKAAVVTPAAAPADNGPKTIQVAGVAPATVSAVELNAVKNDPKTIQISAPAPAAAAAPAEDTTTRKAAVVTPAAAPAEEKFKAANVDDTVKLQRPAPRPAMPGSVAPAAQGNAPAVGGIKLNKPKPAPKPAPKAEPKAEEKPAEEKPAAAADAAAEKPAEPSGNLGKNQTPPKKKAGLKVNTDAIKDLGSSPAAAAPGGAAPTVMGGAMQPKTAPESTAINVSFAIFAVFALLLLVFVSLVATGDYFKIWQGQTADPGKALISIFK